MGGFARLSHICSLKTSRPATCGNQREWSSDLRRFIGRMLLVDSKVVQMKSCLANSMDGSGGTAVIEKLPQPIS
jgi:hypothetical protein